MFRLIRQRLFRVQYLYTNLIDRQRARRLLVVNWGISLLALVGLLLSIVPLVANNTEITSLQISITLGITLILTLIVYWQIQSGRLRWARRLFVSLLTVNALLLVVSSSQQENVVFVALLTVPLVAAGMLLNRSGLILVTMALLAGVLYGAVVHGLDATPLVSGETLFAITATLGLIVLLLFIFRGDLEIIADESQTELQQHQWVEVLSTEVGALTSEQQVLSYVLDAVRLKFEFLSVQVYLVDESGSFTRMMRAGGSEIEVVGRESLSLGEANILNEALRTKEARTTSSDDPLPRRSHLLAAATFGCAIPMWQAKDRLGVMDVQKAELTPFTAREIRVLSMVADQLAIALRRSQQIDDLERNLREREAANQHLQNQVSNYQQRERQHSSRKLDRLPGRTR